MLRVITPIAFETSKMFKSVFNENSLIHISLHSMLWPFRLIETNYQVNIPYPNNSDIWKFTLIWGGGLRWVGIKQIIFKYTTTNFLPNVVRVTLRVRSPNSSKDSRRKNNWTFIKNARQSTGAVFSVHTNQSYFTGFKVQRTYLLNWVIFSFSLT